MLFKRNYINQMLYLYLTISIRKNILLRVIFKHLFLFKKFWFILEKKCENIRLWGRQSSDLCKKETWIGYLFMNNYYQFENPFCMQKYKNILEMRV